MSTETESRQVALLGDQVQPQAQASPARITPKEALLRSVWNPRLAPLGTFTPNAEQQTCHEAAARGKNVFLTGPGGVGKTAMMLRIAHTCADQGKRVAYTAPTGCATVVMIRNGMRAATTFHRWLQMGLANGPTEVLLEKALRRRELKTMIRELDSLVIDEISMLAPRLVTLIEILFRRIRGSTRPFGGVQVVLCGDFCQLLPVEPVTKSEPLLFKREVFKTFEVHRLHVNYRQNSEQDMLLSRIRLCQPTDQDIAFVQSLNKPLSEADEKHAPRLFYKRAEAAQYNSTQLAQLTAQQLTFPPVFSGKDADRQGEAAKWIDNQLHVMDEVEPLCVGAKVMLRRNLDCDLSLINGSVGYIVSWVRAEGRSRPRISKKQVRNRVFSKVLPQVQFCSEGKLITKVIDYVDVTSEHMSFDVSIWRLPLILSYGLTIHKLQGSELECAVADLTSDLVRRKQSGLVYVLLSRLKNLKRLRILGFEKAMLYLDPDVLEFETGVCAAACNRKRKTPTGGLESRPQSHVMPKPETSPSVSSLPALPAPFE